MADTSRLSSAPRGRSATAEGVWSADFGLLTLAVVWGVNFSVIKLALRALHPLAFNALRFPLAAIVLFLIMRTREPLAPVRRRDIPRIVALGLLGHVAYQLLFIFGMDLTSAGNASLLLATTPVWTLAMSVARRHEKPPLVVWAGILTTVVGMVLVVVGGAGAGGGSFAGDVLVVGAAVVWSAYTVGARSLVERYGALRVTAWTLWVGTAGVVAAGLPWIGGPALKELDVAAWAAVGYAGVMGIAVAYLLWYNGVRRIGNARTAAYSNLVPVVALAVAWAWIGEEPGPLQILGAAIILGGLWAARFAGRGGRRSRQALFKR